MENILIYSIIAYCLYLVFTLPKAKPAQANKDEVLEFISGKLWLVEKDR